jgi:hypothetical protein
MKNLRGLSSRKKSVALFCAFLLAFLAFTELYCLVWIALDHSPPHRPWWETCSIALSWGMLLTLVIGLYLLFASRKPTTGFYLAMANIAVFYCISVFEIFNYAAINRVSFFILAIYSAILFIEVQAALGLRKLTKASQQRATR